jgi:hypothetical protein
MPVALLIALASVLAGVEVVTAIGLGVFAYAVMQYVNALGKELGILELAFFLAALQWVFAAFLAYYFDAETLKYHMYVDEQTYMNFVVPGTIAFGLGLHLIRSQVDIRALRNHLAGAYSANSRVPFVLLGIGVLADLALPFAPGVLKFVVFMAVQVQFIAVVYLFAMRSRYRWQVMAVVISLAVVSSAETGMFHNIILWSALLFSFVNLEIKLGRAGRYAIITVGFLVLALVQQVKGAYRETLYHGYKGAPVVLLAEMMLDPGRHRVDDPTVDELGKVNARFNQGWVISAVMDRIPSSRDFDHGASLGQALADSVLPRFLTEKREVFVSDAFREYTGLYVAAGTSIGVSVIGEAWANFGYWGIAFMLAWGLAMSGVLALSIRLSRIYPTLLLWAPLIFLQVVKAETELVVVLNHLVKASVFVALMYIGMRRFLGVRI